MQCSILYFSRRLRRAADSKSRIRAILVLIYIIEFPLGDESRSLSPPSNAALRAILPTLSAPRHHALCIRFTMKRLSISPITARGCGIFFLRWCPADDGWHLVYFMTTDRETRTFQKWLMLEHTRAFHLLLRVDDAMTHTIDYAAKWPIEAFIAK